MVMSALPPKADIAERYSHVGFGPIADPCTATNDMHRLQNGSLDHLVGARGKPRRYLDPKRLRSLKIDHEFEFGCLLDRHVRRLIAIENPARIVADKAVDVGEIGTVAH